MFSVWHLKFEVVKLITTVEKWKRVRDLAPVSDASKIHKIF